MKGVFVLAYQPFEVNGLGWVDEDFNRSINQFNVLGLPEYDTGPEPFIGHIFMSRPSLSISRNMEVIQNLAQLHGIITDTYGLQLAKMLDAYARNKWLPIVTARAKNFNVNDMELRTVEKGGTFLMAQSYLTNGMGAISEDEMPFENNEDNIDISEIQNKNTTTTLYDTISFESIDDIGKTELMSKMKQVISNYGGIYTTM